MPQLPLLTFKRQRPARSDEPNAGDEGEAELKAIQSDAASATPCAHIDRYKKPNHVVEHCYGAVPWARDLRTGVGVIAGGSWIGRRMNFLSPWLAGHGRLWWCGMGKRLTFGRWFME
ncbi:hypothetical protein HOY80DRAFT_224026 [Tuber brumale]|nr:hypothetical protein HOY80DRAFT_224026 [Tuber brumale]